MLLKFFILLSALSIMNSSCSIGLSIQSKNAPLFKRIKDKIKLTLPDYINGTVISSKELTKFGKWHPWTFCPEGSYVNGFLLKVEKPQPKNKDDTGLNQISLMCTTPKGEFKHTISSGEGPYGTWGQVFYCPEDGFGVGFELRSEEFQKTGDDTSANNFGLICRTPSGDKIPVDGDGSEWGKWQGMQLCDKHQAICGIKQQIEPKKGPGDDTALNNVKLYCCNVHQEVECSPEEDIAEEVVVVLDNSNGKTEMNISLNLDKLIGFFYADDGSKEVKFAKSLELSLEETASKILPSLRQPRGDDSRLKSSISPRFWAFGKDWKSGGFGKGWKTFTVLPGIRMEVYQSVLGTCSFVKVKSDVFKRVDIGKYGVAKVIYF